MDEQFVITSENFCNTYTDVFDVLEDELTELQDKLKGLEDGQRKNHATRRIMRRRYYETGHRRSLWSRYR